MMILDGATMNTTTARPPVPIGLHRPWWLRWADDVHAAIERQRRRDNERAVYAALANLSEGTLRDIGAPEWMHERDRGAALMRIERLRS